MSWRIAFGKVVETHKKFFPYFRNVCMVSGGISGINYKVYKEMKRDTKSDPTSILQGLVLCGVIGMAVGNTFAYAYPVSIPLAVYSIYEDLK